MLRFIIVELLLWMIFPLFVRYCLTVKRTGCHIPFKLGPFLVWLLGILGALINIMAFVVIHNSQHDTMEFRLVMFVLSAGFIVRLCMGLTASVLYKGDKK